MSQTSYSNNQHLVFKDFDAYQGLLYVGGDRPASSFPQVVFRDLCYFCLGNVSSAEPQRPLCGREKRLEKTLSLHSKNKIWPRNYRHALSTPTSNGTRNCSPWRHHYFHIKTANYGKVSMKFWCTII